MKWVIIGIVPILIIMWRYMWTRRKTTTRHVMPDVREAMADRLQELASEAREEKRFAEVQHLELQAIWLRTRPDIGGDATPDLLSGDNERHVRFAGSVWECYGSFLAGEVDGYSGCRFKPVAKLPLPKEYLSKTLKFLIDVGEGREACSLINHRDVSEDAIAAMKSASDQLTLFLNVDAEELPSEPEKNEEFGSRFLEQSVD